MAKRPNILVILADHLRADALGCYGNPYARTPHLDALAAEGTRFARCTVTQPTCTPSRASILTGRMPSVLRTRMVGCSMPEEEITLPSLLRGAGYHTLSIGKIHLRPQRMENRLIGALAPGEDYYGFEEVDLVDGHGDSCMGNRYTPWLENLCPGWKEREKVPVPDLRDTHESRVPLAGWSTTYIRERTVEFLSSERAKEQPFFLHVSFPDPHPVRLSFTVPAPYDRLFDDVPFPPPTPPFAEGDGMSELYDRVYHGQQGPNDCPTGTASTDFSLYTPAEWQRLQSRYYGMVALLDENIGMILRALEENGLRDNTILLFLADHGDYLGEHGLHGKGFHFESALRVPLIWAGPGVRAQECAEVASTLDILPTLLEQAGVDEPTGVQGTSFAHYLEAGEGYTRRAALSENDDDFAALRIRTLTTKRYQLNYYASTDYCELFDRESDPRQTRNLARDPRYAAVLEVLRRQLLEEVVCAADTVNGRTQKPAPEVKKWRAKQEFAEPEPTA